MRFSHAVGAILACFIFALAYSFQGENSYPYRKVVPIFLLGFLLAGASMSSMIIQDVAVPLEQKELVYGRYFLVFPIFYGTVIVFALYQLIRQLKVSRGLVRYQIRYFFGGILISVTLASMVNVFLPLMGVTVAGFRNLGPLSILVGVGSISYAIIRYRLMDIHLALRKVVSYGLAVFLLTAVCILPAFVLEHFFSIVFGSPLLYGYLVLVTLTAALFFHSLNRIVQAVVDRYFYRGVYDYFDTLIDANKGMVSMLSRDQLLRFLVFRVVDTVHITGASFYVRTVDRSYTLMASRFSNNPDAPDDNDSRPLLPGGLSFHLESTGDVLLQTDLHVATFNEKRDLILNEMFELQAEVAVPVMVEGKLEGVFLLGSKQSGEPYSSQDVKLLSALASQLSVSLKNSQLYQEVLVMKRYLEGVLEHMGNGLVAVDANGLVTTFNTAAEKFISKTSETVLGKPVEEVLSAELCALLRQTVEDGQCISEVEVTMSAEDSMRYISCSTALMEEPETGGRGAILVISDVTRIKELEQERNTIQRLASLGEVAAGMAHEIKNPSVSIKTFAELLPEKYEDYEFRHNFSRIVSQEIDRINNLVGELLSFSRNTVLRREDVDVGTLVDEVLLLLTPQLDAQKIRLISHFEEGILPVSADRDQLKQAVFNICLNAIQAMPNGGRLRVGVTGVKGGEGEAGWQAGKIRVFVEDTGIGISALERERIFDPFFTTKAEGTGIGLSISHRIVHDHGGTIQVRSNNGSTMFEIYLPRKISSSNDQERFGQGRGDSA
jgi:PAS domain S-box-containing protein